MIILLSRAPATSRLRLGLRLRLGEKNSMPSIEAPASSGPWYKELTGYQWFVFIVCCLAWDMDCMDQQLFNLARRPAMAKLVPTVQSSDPRLPELKLQLEA